jgi:hypothetical protein
MAGMEAGGPNDDGGGRWTERRQRAALTMAGAAHTMAFEMSPCRVGQRSYLINSRRLGTGPTGVK